MDFKELRKKSNIQQITLAEKLNIKQSTVSMWENGKSNPPLNKIPLLANALNVSELEILQCFQNAGAPGDTAPDKEQ